MFSKQKQLVVLGLLLVSLLTASGAFAADAQWDVKYWNNKELSGDAALQRLEDNIDHDWGNDGPPGLKRDNFSARWKRTINVSGGTYRFNATVDDGVRIWVDDRLIIDAWHDSPRHTVTADVFMGQGDHKVRVEYYEHIGRAYIKVTWDKIASGGEPIINWRGEYFNNKSLSGTPAVVRNDDRIDFDWGGGSPQSGIPGDNFSARWARDIGFDAGRYRFTLTADDGARLWVNNQLLIDQWHDQNVTTYNAEINLPGGNIPVRMEYYENGGGAVARLSFIRIDGGGGVPPNGNWRGEYFNNKSLSGTPAVVRNDNNIDFNWGTGSPQSGIASDNFSVRWSRDVGFETGRYRFTITVDDGARLWVNNRLLIDQWRDQAATAYSAEIDLSGGNIPLRMEYYENGGQALARLTFVRVDSGGGVPPSTGWRGEYFNNMTLSGAPTLVRDDPQLSFSWGTGSPAGNIANEHFSARWTRTYNLTAGRYRFTATSDDGVRVWVNDQRIINAWNDHDAQSFSGDITLPSGNATVRVEYYENAGLAEVRLTRTQLDGTTPPSAPMTGVVNTGALNVRSGPGVEFVRITAVYQGQTVTLAGVRNAAATWIKIITPDGTTGWVNARYITTNVSIASLPVGN